jgi:hypothetical protein
MKLKLDLILFGAALIIVGLLADAWRSTRLDSQKLTASLAAQNSIIQQAGNREQQRDKQLNAALAAIAAQKRAVRTPQQAAEQLAAVLPPLPLPVVVSVPVLSPDPAGSANPSSTRSTISSDSKWSIDSRSSIKLDLYNSNLSVNSKSSTDSESYLDSESDSESRIETDSFNSAPAASDTHKWSIATNPPVHLDPPNKTSPLADLNLLSRPTIANRRSATASASTTPAFPQTASTTITIPPADLLPLYDALQDCRSNTLQSVYLQKDLSDEKSRSAALTRERDAAIAVAHGGTFQTRLKRAAKWFAIGAVAAAATLALTHP